MPNIPTKVIVNCETGQQTIVDLTNAEIAQREVDAAAFAVQQAARDAEDEATAAAKASANAKLAALGLTAEEIAALTK